MVVVMMFWSTPSSVETIPEQSLDRDLSQLGSVLFQVKFASIRDIVTLEPHALFMTTKETGWTEGLFQRLIATGAASM